MSRPKKIKPIKETPEIIKKCKCTHLNDDGTTSISISDGVIYCDICKSSWNVTRLDDTNTCKNYLIQLTGIDKKTVNSSDYLKDIEELYSILQGLIIIIEDPLKCKLVKPITLTYLVLSSLKLVDEDTIIDLRGSSMSGTLFWLHSSLVHLMEDIDECLLNYFSLLGPLHINTPIRSFLKDLRRRVLSGTLSSYEPLNSRLDRIIKVYRDTIYTARDDNRLKLTEEDVKRHQYILKSISKFLDEYQTDSSNNS